MLIWCEQGSWHEENSGVCRFVTSCTCYLHNVALDVRRMKNTEYSYLLTDIRTILFTGMCFWGSHHANYCFLNLGIPACSSDQKYQSQQQSGIQYFHITIFTVTGMVFEVVFYMTSCKQESVFSVGTAGNSRLGMLERKDELPRPISCTPEGCRNWNASVLERGWSMWIWSLFLPHFKWQNIPDISFRRDTYVTCELVRDCLARRTFWYIINWNFHLFHRRIAVFLKQTQPRLIISQEGQENRNLSGRLTLKESN